MASSANKDFWLSCGHHLLDRDAGGGLVATDEFLKVYLARPELAPPPEACAAERALHASLLAEPRRVVPASEIATIADADGDQGRNELRRYVANLAGISVDHVEVVEGRRKPPQLDLGREQTDDDVPSPDELLGFSAAERYELLAGITSVNTLRKQLIECGPSSLTDLSRAVLGRSKDAPISSPIRYWFA